MPDDSELRAAWAAAVGTSPDAEAAFDDVVGRHRQAHRRYHTVRHVTWVVRHVQELAVEEPVDDLDAIVVAAFFHDAVYDARATDNEAQSAALARRVLIELGWPTARADNVAQLVQATADHAPSGSADVNVLVDADLAVLGSDPAAYEAYVTGVRSEYAHVDEAAWRTGRGAVLRGMLERAPLFATATGRRRWEARARANVVAELATLS